MHGRPRRRTLPGCNGCGQVDGTGRFRSAGDLRILFEVIENIDAVTAREWNALAGTGHPFTRHEFLAALERQGCLGPEYGWLPRHLLGRHPDGRLAGAVPLYLKYNSYGEFVFDWSWADAYQRNGLRYYPKLLSAIPYTPATGHRLLLPPGPERRNIAGQLIARTRELAAELDVSSLHWLFTPAEETGWLGAQGLIRRTGCQFQWQNRDYRSFDHMLEHMTSSKRKKLRRERRRVREAGLRFRVVPGGEVTEDEWQTWHRLYCATFDRHSGVPTLSSGFFKEIAQSMGEQVMLVLAYDGGRIVAAAFFLVGDDTLYGRHWGCERTYHSLHFETCFYQGLEFCIERGLARFEPGAQGEHKISRGFLPTLTWSAHWIQDEAFRQAIGRHVAMEADAVRDYARDMATHSPFKGRGKNNSSHPACL